MHKLSIPQCRIIGIQRGQNVQGEKAKKPRGKLATGRTNQGQTSQEAKEPDGEQARGRTNQTPPRPGQTFQKHNLWFLRK